MTTLEELKRQNEKLKNQLKAKKEIMEIQEKRNELLKQNKILLNKLKSTSPGKLKSQVGRALVNSSKILGKNVMSFLQRRSREIQQEEMRNRKVRVKPKKRR